MNRETKNLLASIGIGLAILWIFRPKKSTSSEKEEEVIVDKYKEPKVVAEDDKKIKDDAVVGLQAMRNAINDGVTVKELDKLKNMILQENNIKIMINRKTKKLRAMKKDGSVIAEEE
jgi:hypothetical protein